MTANNETAAAILEMMQELVDNARDTVFLNATETVFERLSAIYETAGGNLSLRAEIFPDYF